MEYCTHPYVQYTSQRNTSKQQHPYLSDYLQDFEQKVNKWQLEKTSQSQILKYLILRYCPRRNWSIRFIYCINFSVVPIIQSLKINSPKIQIQLCQCDSDTPIQQQLAKLYISKNRLPVYILSGMGQTSSCTQLIQQHPQKSNGSFLPRDPSRLTNCFK